MWAFTDTIDNALSRVVYRETLHCSSLPVELQIDSYDVSENELLESLIQLLCWVCTFICASKVIACKLILYLRKRQSAIVIRIVTLPHIQVKTYLPVNGKPDASDKGYVSTRYTESKYAWIFRLNVFLAFVFLNILTPIVLAKSFSQYYSKIRANVSAEDFAKCLYQATVFASFIYNVLYTTFSIWNYFGEKDPAITACVIHFSKHPCTIPSDTRAYRDEVNTLLAKLIIIPLAIFVELLMSIYIVRCHSVIMVRRYDQRYHPLKLHMFQSFHVLALWNIMITIQLTTMTAIPLTVLLLTHPQVTILYLIYFLMSFVSLTIIVAYVLYWCQQPRRRGGCRYCGRSLVQFVVIVAILGLMISLLALYELMLLVQAHIETGVKGILLALLPSFPLPALGWYLRRSQKRAAADADEEHMELITEQRQPSNVVENDDSNIDERPLPL